MIKSYAKLAFRNFSRQKVYTFINVFGLSIGIACSILIYFFIKSEFTYDTFHKDVDRIYRIAFTMSRDIDFNGSTPLPVKDLIKENTPEAEYVVSAVKAFGKAIKINGAFFESDIFLVEPDFFDVFSFPLVTGNPKSIVEDPNSIIISKEIQERYFPSNDAVGKTLSVKLNDGKFGEFIIAGVTQKPPENSSITFDFLASQQVIESVLRKKDFNDWSFQPAVTFVKLGKGVDRRDFEDQVNRLIPDKPNLGISWDISDRVVKFHAQKLADMHLSKYVDNRILTTNSDPLYSYILGGIAFLVLVIGCINFMNLSIGISMNRSKEVGVRKVMGAGRKHLIKQFWFESVFLSLFALVFGMMLAELFLPTFNSLSGKEILFDYHNSLFTFFILVVLMLFVGVVSGSYPAIFISGLQPVKALKGSLSIGASNLFRKTLIVLQFSVSIFLIVSTVLMSRQLNYVSDKNLGYNRDQVIIQKILSGGVAEDLFLRYKNEVKGHSNLIDITGSQGALGNRYGITFLEYNGKSFVLPFIFIDKNYLDVMEIALLEGRSFVDKIPSETPSSDREIIVNEAFVKELEISDPVGKSIPLSKTRNTVIIGVVQDFHFQSLKEKIKPMAFHREPRWGISEVALKIKPENISQTISFLETSWYNVAPQIPFNHYFLDEHIENQYRSEENWKKIISYTSYFAILIACMGLFGMTSLSVSRRIKEMGVRKVLGATPTQIVSLFNKEIILLVLLANIAAWPVSYSIMSAWLENFAYRIDIGTNIFLLSTIIALTLAALTVSMQSVKAANMNPAHTLRNE